MQFSKLLESKLAEVDTYLDDSAQEIRDLLAHATSPARFDSLLALQEHVTPGALLNVNSFVSQAITIPAGEYVVWSTNNDRTVLMPTGTKTVGEELVSVPQTYELHTRKLLGFWDKLERVIGEDDWRGKRPGRIHPLDRKVASAVTSSGKSQEEIADAMGVDPSTVSRWMTDDEKAGRTPTLAHAGQMADLVGADPDAVFRELETAPAPSVTTHKRKKTRGSGGGRNPAYRQGTN